MKHDSKACSHGRFTESVIRQRRVVVLITLALPIAAGLATMRISLKGDFVTYLNAKNPDVRAWFNRLLPENHIKSGADQGG
jgi:hypothetical protein